MVWLIFIFYEITFLHFTAGYNVHLFNAIIFYILNIGLFYFNAHVVLDFAFFKTKLPYWTAILLILTEMSGYLFIKYGIDLSLDVLHMTGSKKLRVNEQYVFTNLWRCIYFIGLSIAYWSMLYMLRFKEKNHRIETEQLKTVAKNLELENKYMSVENAYLQNQISPHLLFNSLNFIYNTVYLKSENAGKSVMRLAELMRYSLVSADDTRTVMLCQEVEQLENLVELCRMRFGEEFFLRVRKKGKLAGVRIIPLVLITLVENMMKHGDLGDKRLPAQIILEQQENKLVFETRNKKRNTSLYPKGGLGLKNIEKRLNNYYHERYTLLARDVEDLFTVNLTIDL
jgi:hypothetical protein